MAPSNKDFLATSLLISVQRGLVYFFLALIERKPFRFEVKHFSIFSHIRRLQALRFRCDTVVFGEIIIDFPWYFRKKEHVWKDHFSFNTFQNVFRKYSSSFYGQSRLFVKVPPTRFRWRPIFVRYRSSMGVHGERSRYTWWCLHENSISVVQTRRISRVRYCTHQSNLQLQLDWTQL